MTMRIQTNHYLNDAAAIANLRRAGCLQKIADDKLLRPDFNVGRPSEKPDMKIYLDELGQYWYHKRLSIVA